MRRSIGGAVRTLLIAFVVLAGIACGKSGGGDDLFQFPDVEDALEDAAEVTGTDIPAEVGETGPGDVPTVDGVTDLPGEAVVGPCSKDKDCENADLGVGEKCRTRKICQKPANVCAFTWESNCCREAVVLEQGFENGLEGWTVSDPNLKDAVTWSVTDHRKALGSKSLYFGDPACHTYYNGALDQACKPVDATGRDVTVVRASVTSPTFLLPPLDSTATFYVSFSVWIDSEPLFEGVENQPDQFRLMAVESPGTDERLVDVFKSVDVNKTTGGTFLHVVGDLTQWAGTEIALRLFFDSLDEGRNAFEGVYVDDLKVASGCEAEPHRSCTAANPCPADEIECTSDGCQMFSNSKDRGVCEYPSIPTCVEPECTPANVATKCPVTAECMTATCPAGACVFQAIPPETCCKVTSLLSAAFDDDLDGFTVWAYQNNTTTRWQLSPKRSVSGGHSLYFGNLATHDFSGDVYAFGEATSPSIAVPATGFTFLSFQLFLSTEFDVPNGDYYNPMGRDFFETIIVTDPGTPEEATRTVWSSHNVKGTTLKAFTAVGVDLTEFAGKTVQVRFRFDPSDIEMNAFEGVYIDDLAVVQDVCKQRDCKSPADCLVDGVCRTGSCADEVCDVQTSGAAGCCSVQTDCDDDDPCTTDGCLQNLCFHDAIEVPGCCIPRTVSEFHFDVRTDLDGFAVVDESMPGALGAVTTWALSDARAKSPTRSMRFGNEVNYDNGGLAKGSASTPLIAVPAVGQFELTFELFLSIEPNSERDRFTVEVVEGVTATEIFNKTQVSGESYDAWYAVPAINLTPWKGKNIRLRFSFDSVDATQNSGLGIFVDDILLRKACP